MRSKLVAAILSLALPSVALAGPRLPGIPLTLAYVTGTDEVGLDSAEKALRMALPVINSVRGVRMYHKRSVILDEKVSDCDILDLKAHHRCLDYFVKRYRDILGGPKEVVAFVLPPVHANGTQYLWESAHGSSFGKRGAFMTINAKVVPGVPVYLAMMAQALVHGWGHIASAPHDDTSCLAMNSDAFTCVKQRGTLQRYSSTSAAFIAQAVAKVLGGRL